MMTTVDELGDLPYVSLCVINKKSQRQVGAAVFSHEHHSAMVDTTDEKSLKMLRLFEFCDNDQFSNLDCFLNQIGNCVLFLSDEITEKSKGDDRKIFNIVGGKDVEVRSTKKGLFVKKAETADSLLKLVGRTSHTTNSVETEMPVALGCVECLFQTLQLCNRHISRVVYGLSYGSLNNVMRLDSAAADAVNLLPKPDHPSVFGSLYGILNRCRTKLGSRLLDRWLRQPLLDEEEIFRRQEVVQAFFQSTHHRNELREGPLKAVPDLDAVLHKMHLHNAGLDEIFRLYLFVRSIPALTASLLSLVETLTAQHLEEGGSGAAEDVPASVRILCEKYVEPLQSIAGKFALYEQLVEHVIDLSRLPELRVSAAHDPELQEIEAEQAGLQARAERVLQEARTGWASFADVKLEQNAMHGFVLRTTRADDERQLRANLPTVRVISILKNGVHFTTPALERMAERYLALQGEYDTHQSALVVQALDAARTYMSVVEAVAALIAELDVLASFATAAALAPGTYVRPKVLKRGTGVINLKAARHPCVELMDATQQFIANDYCLLRGQSAFQIVTGPNMGGKSTYIRGVGCIAVLAQVGSFVPCDSAELSVTDCILARVGAGDAVQKGVSTFMAEMLESAVMLQTATADSLIIIDELGRGTSTFDGFGLAWSISDYIVTQLRCPCLFATHFHELTALAKEYPQQVVNRHVSAHVQDNQVVMLYQLSPGPCTQSFGIHVAQTAQFPACVIAEAKRKAHCLEQPAALASSAHDNTKQEGGEGSAGGGAGGGYSPDAVAKMRTQLGAYCALDAPRLPAAQLVQEVRTLFGAHDLGSL